MVLLAVSISAKITDYTNSNYIPIMDGDANIWEDFEYLKHSTNLTLYSTMVKETEEMRIHFPRSHMRQILDSDIRHIRTLIATINIHHRHARSIKWLGTALKVVAGTPDFDDFENIKFTQKELIESEHRQITINTKIQEQINELTNAVNILVKDAKAKQINTEHLYETLLSRNRIIIFELETLILSVVLAKIGIINPTILDSNDLNNIIINEHSTNITITDLLEIAQIKVLLNDNFLHFVIRYPKIKLVCKRIVLHPVQHNGTILNFAENNNIADCGNQIMPIVSCSATLTTTFCKKLPTTTCAQQLHSGGTAHCTTRPSHLEPITVIDDGVIIINDGKVTINGQLVTGTFLLTFDDEVKINDSVYRNLKNYVKKSPVPAVSTLLNITGHQEILSLPYLQNLNMKNLRYIGEMEKDLVKRPIISGVTATAFLVICYTFFKFYQKRQRIRRQHGLQVIVDSFKKSEDVLHLSKGGVNTIAQQQNSCQTNHAMPT